MISRRWKHAASAATLVVCLAAPLRHATAQTADNTSQNKEQPQTADKQSNAKSDVETTAKIRKQIMADKDLSTYAHNVKIITVNGAVTLKGPVTSETERQRVAQLAAGVVSTEKVSNELTVK
jgi:osmotically-inducible protein OsmY